MTSTVWPARGVTPRGTGGGGSGAGPSGSGVLPPHASNSRPAANADGSVDIYFSPKRPEGAANWIQTVPGKSWFTIFRLYGPLAPWFDKSWRLPDIEPV